MMKHFGLGMGEFFFFVQRTMKVKKGDQGKHNDGKAT